jgi:prepilin-type N-terminal cleavage/methylation domain-containing protein
MFKSMFRSLCVTSQGFTLVELLVGIGIMTSILGITLSGSPAAIMKLTLADNAYQSELLIREAQLQGSAINSVNGRFGGVGVFFDRASSSQVLKFKDTVDPTIQRAIGVGDGVYDSSPSDEKESIFKLVNNHHIGKLCVATTTVSTSSIMCNNENNPPVTMLTVVFERPKQTAHIYVNNSTSTEYAFACIQFDSIKSPAFGFVKSILVYQSGMITRNSRTCK